MLQFLEGGALEFRSRIGQVVRAPPVHVQSFTISSTNLTTEFLAQNLRRVDEHNRELFRNRRRRLQLQGSPFGD
jgi:hypothetical protein